MKKKNILVVEDNEGDVFLIQEALENMADELTITVINDGREAIEYLHACEQQKPIAIDLITLDINLPRCSGLDVLEYVKTNPALASIPVVMFTSSSNMNDNLAATSLHANAFITKPIILDEFIQAVIETVHFFTHYHSKLN